MLKTNRLYPWQLDWRMRKGDISAEEADKQRLKLRPMVSTYLLHAVAKKRV